MTARVDESHIDPMGALIASPDLPVFVIRTPADFDEAIDQFPDRSAYEEMLERGYAHVDEFRFPAICQVCGGPSALVVDHQFSEPGRLNFRERFACPGCQLNSRQRFVAHLVSTEVARRGGRPRVYLHEQITSFYDWAKRSLVAEVAGSEYLGPDVDAGAVIDGIRHEDALALTFADASFDLIISQEVFEHVPSIERAIDETVRVLAPGGRLLLSVPFNRGAADTVQRARIVDGQLEHLLEPAYHGNPLSDDGSLVFYDYGWDLLDMLRAQGLTDVSIVGVWSALYGYFGDGLIYVISATRP